MPPPAPSMATAAPVESCTGEQVAVVNATGYIGKAVVRESVRPTRAVMRDVSKGSTEIKFDGAELAQFDVTDRDGCRAVKLFAAGSVDAVVCCLDFRSGTKGDSFAIDYRAALNCAEAAGTPTPSSSSTPKSN